MFGELRAEGRTLLVASHDVESARLFDLVLCLHGRQVAFGPPAEVLRRETLEATYGSELIVLEEGGAGPGRDRPAPRARALMEAIDFLLEPLRSGIGPARAARDRPGGGVLRGARASGS